MKITGDPLAYAAKPEKGLRAALVYGPNAALALETVQALRAAIMPGVNDDLAFLTVTPEMIKANPNLLAEEMAAHGFFAAKKFITLRNPADGAAKAVAEALDAPDAGHFLCIAAEELTPKSALRLWAEKAKNVAALACYNLEGAALSRHVAAQFKKYDAAITPDAVALLIDRLGDDLGPLPQIVRQLIDYAGDGARIAEEHVEELLVDRAEQDKDAAIAAFADGDFKTLDRALQDMHQAGHSVIGLLRMAQNYFWRLRRVQAAVAAGETMDEAIKLLRPPLFFKARTPFMRHARNWPVKRIDLALAELLALEAACKKTGTPELELVQQRLIALHRK